MQFPESWLREFCNPALSSADLAELLTMAGMEVEDSRPVAPAFTGVVVAQVLEVARHPNADRLSVCRVDAGTGTVLNIVCGAPNVQPGIKVPCAMVGASLPAEQDGSRFEIKLGKLRGVESQGMLCSARELKLSDDHGGLLILAEDAPVGQDLRSQLQLDDNILTLKLTPNLAHALSVYGVAREVSALTGAPLQTPSFPPVPAQHREKLPVRIEASDLCGRFSGRIIRDVDPQAATPAWMVDRLARCGQRAVSALVDISNYVMFEYGRPTHIFDLDKIQGGLSVRWGRVGEKLELLNGSTIDLDDQVGVIADEDAVESLAAIMGGKATAVSNATRNVYVEAAFWWPQAVAGRSRRFNFTTEAGHRFERGVDPALTVDHIERISRLIIDICGGKAGPVDDQTTLLPRAEPVTLRVDRAAKVIGMPISQAQCEGVMRRLGLLFKSEPGRLSVSPPSWRFDLKIEEDLIEEVIRVLGYDTLGSVPPRATLAPLVASETRRTNSRLRRDMAALGYQETINFSFVEERWEHELAGNAQPIRVLNPIASPLSVMRSSLLGSLLSVLRYNLARKCDRVRVFELGRAYFRDAGTLNDDANVAGLRQPLRLGGLVYGAADELQWGVKERAADFFDVKGDIEALFAPRHVRFVAGEHPALHPGRNAGIELDGRPLGHVGELHPKWRMAYELPGVPLLFELDAGTLLELSLPSMTPVARHQPVWRDLCVIAAEAVAHDDLVQAIVSAGAPLVRSVRLWDIYKPATAAGDKEGGIGAEERSLTLRLELLDDDATLTEDRIDAVAASVLAALKQRHGARLRA
ncbi:MAG: phenylalanine--tRNA ligase subunit beta [Burkholderiaceae bacterium]